MRGRTCQSILASALLLLALGSTPLQASEAPEGVALFQTHCVVCHRAAGVGTPGLAPPLTTTPARLANTSEGRRQLIWTLLYGMFGEITVDDRRYNFKMPLFSKLNDDDLSLLLNYLVATVGGNQTATPFGAGEIGDERSRSLDGAAVHAHRALAIGTLAP